MSHQHYQALWRQAHLELDALLSEDQLDLYQNMKDEVPRLIYKVLAGLYLRYLQVYRKFETCLDQIVHPQKRMFLRKVVETLMGRIQELKFEMVNLDQSDFQFLYTYAMEMGYAMIDLEVPIPRYVANDRYDSLHERDALLQKFAEKLENLKVRRRNAQSADMSAPVAASTALQFERCRQAWVAVEKLATARKLTLHHKDNHRRFTLNYSVEQVAAVRRIQAFWKSVKIRQLAKKFRRKDLRILNIIGNDHIESTSHQDVIDEIAEKRRALQRRNEANYQKQLMTIKEQVKETEGLCIINHIEIQIRQWFLEYRDATGQFPEYPTEEEGGSASLFILKNPQELAAELDKLRLEREKAEAEALEAEKAAAEGKKDGKGKGKGKGAKNEKGGKDAKKGKKSPADKKDGKKGSSKDDKEGKGKGKKKGKEEEETGWKPLTPQSAFIKDMNESMIVFHDFWERRDDHDNLDQEFDTDIVKAQKRGELKKELRQQADQSMRKELEYLKLAIDGHKPKKHKKPKKGKKGKKHKKEKDLTPDRTAESIFEELAMNNVISLSPTVRLKDYLGSARVIAEQLREGNYDFDLPLMPQAEELRAILTHYCVVPMASVKVREKTPSVKSLLLAGPPHNGKHMLASAICTELGACRFNLNLNFIKPVYRGKSGITMLLHLIFKMARIFQPSVIVVNSAENLFSKKAPKTFKPEFRAIRKQLQKIVKKMPIQDRILILGLTSIPADCEVKGTNAMFNKIIPVPLPDYHARVVILNETLKQLTEYNFLAVDPHLISVAAKITEYFSAYQLIQLANSVSKRAATAGKGSGDREPQLDPKLITVDGFVTFAAEGKPFYGKPLDQFEAWYAKMPINKKRRLLLEDKLGLNDPPDKKGKQKGQKGPKKK